MGDAPAAAGGQKSSGLATRKCAACSSVTDPMSRKEAEAMVLHVPGWAIADGQDGVLMISKRLRAKNFVKALEICQRYGAVAEEEGHHPDLHVTGWNMLRVDISTHAAGGLTENDFILAAKFDEVDLADLLSKKQPAGLTD